MYPLQYCHTAFGAKQVVPFRSNFVKYRVLVRRKTRIQFPSSQNSIQQNFSFVQLIPPYKSQIVYFSLHRILGNRLTIFVLIFKHQLNCLDWSGVNCNLILYLSGCINPFVRTIYYSLSTNLCHRVWYYWNLWHCHIHHRVAQFS